MSRRTDGDRSSWRGSAPVRLLEYQTELTAYTKGRMIELRVSGYRPGRDQEQIVKELGL